MVDTQGLAIRSKQVNGKIERIPSFFKQKRNDRTRYHFEYSRGNCNTADDLTKFVNCYIIIMKTEDGKGR